MESLLHLAILSYDGNCAFLRSNYTLVCGGKKNPSGPIVLRRSTPSAFQCEHMESCTDLVESHIEVFEERNTVVTLLNLCRVFFGYSSINQGWTYNFAAGYIYILYFYLNLIFYSFIRPELTMRYSIV